MLFAGGSSAGRESGGRLMSGPAATSTAPAVGVRVVTHGFGAEPSADRSQRQPGVIIEDLGPWYTTVLGDDGQPLVRRWAVALDDGMLVFRHTPHLDCEHSASG